MIKNGVPASRLAASGYGEFQPIATGNTDADRQKNRRIELKLTQRVQSE
jgi:chemotaxis protein MotB